MNFTTLSFVICSFILSISSAQESLVDQQWALKINSSLQDAWKITKGEGVIVAVMDSGVDYLHPDLRDSMWTNTNEIPNNGIDDDNNGYIDDYYGIDLYDKTSNNDVLPVTSDHGTHVAGIIAAGENSFGTTGIAPKAKIMAIKRPFGEPRDGFGEGVIYAAKMGAKIINMSFGTYKDVTNTDLYTAIKQVGEEYGVIVIATSGNDSMLDTPRYPSAFDLPNVISVASISQTLEMSKFSNYGLKFVDIFAPGDKILSTLPGNIYKEKSGTSMAAPYVAGVAALIIAKNGAKAAVNMRERLIDTSMRLKSLSGLVYSNGLIDPLNAVLGQTSFDFVWAP